MPEPYEGWKYFQTQTPFDTIRIYQGDVEPFKKLYNFFTPGDEVVISNTERRYLYFPLFRISLDTFDLSGHDIEKLKIAKMYTAEAGTDPDRGGIPYIEVRAYEDPLYRPETDSVKYTKKVYTIVENGVQKEAIDTFEVSNYYNMADLDKMDRIEVNSRVTLAENVMISYNDREMPEKYCGLRNEDGSVFCAFKKDQEEKYLDVIREGSQMYVVDKEEEYDELRLIFLTIGVFQ